MKRSWAGFTLLELMIVLVIMSTLSVMSSQSIQQAIKNKVKLQQQVDDMSQVRDTLKVMERDVNLAFHYSDLEMELREVIKKKRTAASKPAAGTPTTTTLPGQAPQPAFNPNDPADPLNQKSADRLDPATHFVGKEQEMYFVTLNSSRVNEGTQQADFVKVGYMLQTCRRPGQDKDSPGKCLIRRTSPFVEGDVMKQEEATPLLTEITEFKLRYLGKGKQDWANEWSSVQGDAITKNRFPDAVEISLTVEKGATEKKKKISMQLVVPIRFPNNFSQDAAAEEAQKQTQNPNGTQNPGAAPPPPPPPKPGGG